MKSHLVAAARDAVDGDQCLVALGGGADSAVLLWAATEALGPERVTAAFVFHDLEGSTMLRESARAVATQLGVEIVILERPIVGKGNVEARARTARYEAMEEVLSDGATGLTGHNADDQVETIVMRLFRGSGSGALAGIPMERGVWRRPLLGVSRADLRQIAQDLALPYADDPANTDTKYLRSRIRSNVLPTIDREMGADARSNVLKSGSLLAADDAMIQAAASRIPTLRFPGGVSIPIAPLTTAPSPVASRCVRGTLRTLLGGLPGTAADVETVLRVASGASSASISAGLQVTPEAPFVTIHVTPPLPTQDGFDIGSDETFVWHGEHFTVTPESSPSRYISGGRFTLLDAESAQRVMSVRGPVPGDRIDTGEGLTPVKEVLRAAGVAPRVRPYALVVTVDGKIAALPGIRVAAWAVPHYGQAAILIGRDKEQ